MTTATATPTGTSTEIGTKIAFEDITQPGAYICNATGHLLRISETWDADAMSAWFEWTGDEPFWFTSVSSDPACSIEQCRANADDIGIGWSF
jgi:hypothetical protein